MKAAIDLMGRKLSSSEYSHQTSWAYLRANQLRNLGFNVDVLDNIPRGYSDWSEYDVVYVYHGMDYHVAPPGYVQALNVFDGMVESAAKFYERLGLPQHDHIKYISMDIDMPNYGKLCKYKKGEQSEYWANVNWGRVEERCQNVPLMTDPGLFYAPGKIRHLTLGDSHSHSVYRAGSMVLRKDGRTLNGVLKKTIGKEIADGGFDLKDLDSLTCYWGNIDIRHHVYREADPKAYTRDLLKRYEADLKTLDRPVELVTPLPIEDESRKIPTSGFYKGTPFTGTQAQRIEILDLWKGELAEMAARNPGWSLYSWPKVWYEMDGVEFMQTYMERPRSVHLARKFYRWDLVNNVANPLLLEVAAKTPVSKLLDF